MLSVILPFRNESMLGFTLTRLRETLRIPHEIIAVDDASDQPIEIPKGIEPIRLPQSLGCDQARHKGIEAARYEAILVLDAHMNFTDDGWAEELVKTISSHPDHITCCTSVCLSPDDMAMTNEKKLRCGAHLLAKKLYPKSTGAHPAFLKRVLEPVWNKTIKPGPVGCILGATYGFSRSWYLDQLRGPWQSLYGFGCSEALLSISNYLMGGTNVALPIKIGHMYRNLQGYPAPYLVDTVHIVFNQLYLLNTVVQDSKEREALTQHLDIETSLNEEDQATLSQLLESSDYQNYRDYLIEKGSKTWNDYQQEWMS